MNKKLILVVALTLLMAVMTGCTPTKVESKVVNEKPSIFVLVERTYGYDVVYDRETKVMYAVSNVSSGSGYFALLVNQDGSPKLWKVDEVK
jgi:hypothetical protein